MNIQDLIIELQKYPGHTEVFIRNCESEFRNNPVEYVQYITMDFSESPGEPAMASDDVVVLMADDDES